MIKMKNDKNTTYWNLCDTTKVVLRRKFMPLNVYIRKEKKGKNQ